MRATSRLLGTTAILLLLTGGAATAQDETELRQVIEAQQQELERLRERLERLERDSGSVRDDIEAIHRAREETEADLEDVLTRGAEPGSFRVPGTSTSVKIGGYVKADLIYDAGPENGDSFAASAIPADGSAGDRRSGKFRAHARQTRLNLSTWTPTEIGEATLFLEGDFFGGGGNQTISNSTSFRLRHAFGEIGPVLAGQTWSLFMPLTAYPETVDFFGPAGIPFLRQGQLRYTHSVEESWKLAVSIENSELSATDASGQSVGSDSGDLRFGIDTLPDLVGAVSYDADDWHGRIAGVARLLETESAGSDDNELGWGLTASAAIPLTEQDSIRLNGTFGDGVGRYIINGAGQDAFVDANGILDAIQSWGVALGYTHSWSEKWRSNLVYGRYQVLDTSFADDTESLDTVHANLIWEPDPKLRFGFEYIFGNRSFDDGGLDNQAHRLQFAAQFLF